MPRYSRQHYVDIAETLARTRATRAEIDRWVRKFKADNSRFDEQRFRDYIKKKKK